MIKIRNAGPFNLQYQKLVRGDAELKTLVIEKIRLFSKNSQDTRLLNHPLTKKLEGKWAFSITSDIRIVYKWMSKNTVRFLALGPHNQVYKKLKSH